ncbi:GreA/GreB family elongation factor [Simiduia curdlanivorans]|uniref:GreA/GreB family elongation factor n=1 Tax=Simiduia curdlanivorans TaxID=1492769 RepID=A0ABV8V2H9_9GAMM|nr:GreA/GreB family elongation factor [Simiduia curdlanivorans]MDN3637487.1 GreA/GreB family elongation factor [Simiduia curdlanivorans]
MKQRKNSSVYLKKSDYLKLINLLKVEFNSDAIRALEDEIDRAKIIADDSIGTDIVCIDSLVTFLDIDSEKEITVQLVMPADASIENSKISILSPIGSALIGLKKHGYIEWPMPTGKIRRMCITEVAHQNNGITQ